MIIKKKNKQNNQKKPLERKPINEQLVKPFPFLIFFSQSRAQPAAHKPAPSAERQGRSQTPLPPAGPRRPPPPVPAGPCRRCGHGAAPLGGAVVPKRRGREGAAAARRGLASLRGAGRCGPALFEGKGRAEPASLWLTAPSHPSSSSSGPGAAFVPRHCASGREGCRVVVRFQSGAAGGGDDEPYLPLAVGGQEWRASGWRQGVPDHLGLLSADGEAPRRE